ncbi:DUF3606 domain-containing protein [Mesorhizobium sp. AR10]|nr:DUF3606 domain-containing protein [Mesorhizobium sp. AR10]
MTEEETRRPVLTPQSLRALARECGVTEQQIREIIALVGTDRASILREARVLKNK